MFKMRFRFQYSWILLLFEFLFLCQAADRIRGKWSAGFSFGGASQGGLYFEYLPMDYVGIRFHVGSIPDVYDVGAALALYPLKSYSSPYFLFGVSEFGGMSRGKKINGNDTLQIRGKSYTGIDFGLGGEFQNRIGGNFFLMTAGGTKIISKKFIYDKINKNESENNSIDVKWMPLFELGGGKYFSHK